MIQQIVPIFLVISFGFVLSLLRVASKDWVPVLNKFGLYVGFPILIFVNMIELDRELLISQLPVVGITIAIICTFMLITYLTIRVFQVPLSIGTLLIVAVFNGNTGYLGFPLITAIIPGSEPTIGLIVAAYTISLYTVGIFLLDSLTGENRSPAAQFRQIITSPFLIAIICGVIVIYTEIQLPEPLMSSFYMIEAAAGPVVLVSLGIFMFRKISIRSILLPFLLLFVVKMVVFPAVFMFTGSILSLGKAFQIASLEAAMPSAVSIFALSDRYPFDKELAASMIVISTLISPLLFPMYVALIS